jgi:hypothetical protein
MVVNTRFLISAIGPCLAPLSSSGGAGWDRADAHGTGYSVILMTREGAGRALKRSVTQPRSKSGIEEG